MEDSDENVIQYYEILDPTGLISADNTEPKDPLALDTDILTNSTESYDDPQQQQILYYIQTDSLEEANLILAESGLDLSIENESYENENPEESEANEEIFKIITMQGGQIIMTETYNLDDIEINTDDTYKSNKGFREIDLDGTRAFIQEPVWQLFANKEGGVDLGSNAIQDQRLIEKRRFNCRVEGCGKYYMSSGNLMVHMRSHTGLKPFICPIASCGKDFVTGYSLKTHLRCHSGEKPYPCMVCGKSFKTSGDLSKHYRTHTGERPFLCPIPGCNKRFTTSNIRKVHVRSHTGERPYICDFENCGKSFASATNHKNHIRIHTGEKPYACKVEDCNKRFTEYSSLYKHSLVHIQHQQQQPQQQLFTLGLDSTVLDQNQQEQLYTASVMLSGDDGDDNDMATILLHSSVVGGTVLQVHDQVQHREEEDDEEESAMSLDSLVGDVDDYMG